MASRGFLIRFIDIGLIVLFGFLMISDIDVSSRVELADAREAAEEPADDEPTQRGFVLVEVGSDGAYRVSDPRLADDVVRADDPDALAAELRRRDALNAEAELETIVLLQPHPASLVQETVDAMDVCDRLGLPKSLRMDIEIAPPPGADDEGSGR